MFQSSSFVHGVDFDTAFWSGTPKTKDSSGPRRQSSGLSARRIILVPQFLFDCASSGLLCIRGVEDGHGQRAGAVLFPTACTIVVCDSRFHAGRLSHIDEVILLIAVTVNG